MKISEVTAADVIEFIREDETDSGLPGLLAKYMAAALAYLKGYTGLEDAELDEHDDLTIAYLILVGDMYDKRTTTANGLTVNKTLETILSMYSKNNVG